MGTIASFFTTYLIFPIIALFLIVFAVLIGKKNFLLKNKRLMVYTLLSITALTCPALLGLLYYDFMPYAYISLSCLYLILGLYNDKLLTWVFDNKKIKYHTKIIYSVFQVTLSMLFFALIFNLCNELKYGILASTVILPIILVSLLVKTYDIFIHIPALVYKVWNYDATPGYSAPEDIDHSKLKVVTVELFKQAKDSEPIHINAKVPEEMLFGDWIKLLFEDYNKKSINSPIDVSENELQGWIFYVKSWLLTPRRYIDYELTVKENRIKEKHLIVAKRVRNDIIE